MATSSIATSKREEVNREIELVYDSKAAYSLSDSAILVTGDRINMPLVDMADQPSQLEALRSTYGFGVSGLGDAGTDAWTQYYDERGAWPSGVDPYISGIIDSGRPQVAIAAMNALKMGTAAAGAVIVAANAATSNGNTSKAPSGASNSWWNYVTNPKPSGGGKPTSPAPSNPPGIFEQAKTSILDPLLNYLANKPQRTVVRVTKGPPPGPDMMTIGLLVGGVLLTGILVFAVARSGKRS